MEHAWMVDIEDVARKFNVNLITGLSAAQVIHLRSEYGKNGEAVLLEATNEQHCQKICLPRYGGWCWSNSRISW
jgi:Cation transporter/ATPase, N-terminus